MSGCRWRNTYYLTGLPGWMRFGYSPGWIGRSPTGLPPTAQYLAQTGQMPLFTSWLQQQAPVGMPKEKEISMIETQAKALEQQLEQIKKRLEEFRK